MVSYGWGCRLEIDDLWQGRPVPTTGLRAFIRESIERGVFPLGDGDLFIEAPSKLFRFQICHESDLHFRSEEPLLVDDVRSRWASAGIEVPAV